MEIRNLGNQGLTASQMGLGCMGMSEFYGSTNDAESLRVLDRALEIGINFWDTADMYGPFKNELLLGKALFGRRQQVTLATKFGITREGAGNAVRGLNAQPAYVQKACEDSLKRLKTDVIDLYYLHRVDPNTPIEETVGAMSRLVEQGKVRCIGLSEVSVEALKKAHEIHPITAVQTEYSLWSREPEDGMLQTCAEMGIAFVAYSPLGRGFLTGQIQSVDDFEADDYRRTSPRFQGQNFERNLQLVARIKLLAKEKSCTPAQLALAWVMAMGKHIFPIPGTKKVAYLEENAAAVNLHLLKEELQQIADFLPLEMVAGTRYPQPAAK